MILAGGTGSRMGDLCRVVNKHLLPVGGYPMIGHALKKLTSAGIDDVLVVTSPEGVGPLGALLGSGDRCGCRVTFRVQDAPGGIAQALLLAEDFVGNERLLVALGDNLFRDPLPSCVFALSGAAAWVALARVRDPWRYGVATLDASGRRIASIEEKPREPKSDLAVCGIYCYPPDVFDAIRTLSPSARGELEITDVNSHFLRRGRLEHVTLSGWWIDAGTPEALEEANRLVREQPPLW